MAYEWLDTLGNYTCTKPLVYTPSNIPTYPALSALSIGDTPQTAGNTNHTWDISDNLKITYVINAIYEPYTWDVMDVPNNVSLASQGGGNAQNIKSLDFLIAIDYTNQIAKIYYAICWNSYPNEYQISAINMTTAKQQRFYELIQGAIPVLYTWSSVPAISGKNGILSLTEILNINDGNAVNDVALSGNISLSSSSRISAIISGIIQNEGSATVKYSVPSNTYSYIKLVYKQDKIPTSVNDGTAVDLDPTATSIDVIGFSKTVGTKYYLVIFTDKSTSDEYSYEVGNPPPRFSIPKKFVSDNGTFHWNIPSWIEDRVLSVLGTDPTTTTIYFDVENYPAVANLYSHQFVEYPLQFRTYYGTYPETGSRPATSSYIAKDYKLEWLWTSGSAYRDETDYLKTNGEWVSVYTQGSGRSRADSNFESFVAEMFILDHIEKKGYPAYFSWAHSENWSGRKYQCQISKMGTNSRYADLATAIYNALK